MCKAESCTTAAGFVLRTLKRLWACYKLEGVHTPLRDPLCIRSVCPRVYRKTATLCNRSGQPAPPCLRPGRG